MAEENKLQEMIRTSLESIRAMVDANTVVGTPIQTPAGTTIIPISKVSVGYASGGVDFNGKNAPSKNFGGGGGTGLTLHPVCFLAVNAEGEVELLELGQGKAGAVDLVADAIEKAPDVLSKLKKLFKRKKKSDAQDDEEFEQTVEAAAEAAAEILEDEADDEAQDE